MNEKSKIVKISSEKLEKLEKSLMELKAENAKLKENLISAFQNEDAVEEYKNKFQSSADYIFEWENWFDSEGRLVWVNPGVEKITGFTPEECLAMDDFPMSLIYSADRTAFEEKFNEIRNGSSEQGINFRVKHKNGQSVLVTAACITIIGKNGEKLGIRATIRDIS